MSNEQKRIDSISEVLIALAKQDFRARATVSERLDEIDAIAVGINMLAEELDGAVASRRELEAAYAELQETQAQLVIAEKFAAIGQLANGVAHELNNPSSWILLGLDHAKDLVATLRARARGDDELLADLDATLCDAQAGMERIRVVVGDLRTLSRGDGDATVDVMLNEVVELSCKLARPAYQNTAKVVLELGDIPLIRGSQARLGQLVTNLLLNAAHAIGAGGVGNEIVSVEDTGPGIPADLRERVFEPYFTTKPVDVGTGLGLALVRKIATAHGGDARVGVGRRCGACIEVLFPVPRRTTAERVAQAAALAATPTLRGRVLIIDDEPMLLRAISSALDDYHDVVIAEGGAEALAVLERDRAFDLIICDLQMPVLDGVAVYEAVAAKAPERLASLVFMTGGAVTARVQSFLARTQPRVLEKPFELDALFTLAASAAAQRAS
jgi:signal transduction histidine kinase/ActR/RegA family two-component response regulator